MSVVPMKLITLAGPMAQFDAVMCACVVDQEFHPENTFQYMREIHGILPISPDNPYLPLLRRGETLAGQLELPLQYQPFEACPTSPEEQAAYFHGLETTLAELNRQRNDFERDVTECRSVIIQLENLVGLTANLAELRSMSHAHFRYGYLPRETYDSFKLSIFERDDIFFFATSKQADLVYGVYFTTSASLREVDALFNALHFVRIQLDARADGTAEGAIANLNARINAASQGIEDCNQEIITLCETQKTELLSIISYLRYHSEICDLQRFAVRSQEAFYLMGWVPAHEVSNMEKRVNSMEGLSVSYVVDNPDDVKNAIPPTKLKNNFFARIFEPFLTMYGLPSYHEFDPSLFMAITYCIFFGIMFGDVGQGLGLALLGLLLTHKKKMWLGNIITCCGLSGAFFGCIYGSVFGFEDLLPGFKVLSDNNVIILLGLSIALGVLMLGMSMVINVANGIRQKNWEKILFGSNGIAGMVFYLGILFAGVTTIAFGINLFIPTYVLPVLILPLVLILLREPLCLMMKHDPEWKRVSLGSLLGIGFFELFEILLSYLTNTLSFLRIGAYAITHVGLMLVVQMMAGANLNPIVLILGNLFVMGFEGFLVGIQVLRLEFYELFGRFYADGGLEYQPKTIQYATKSK